MHRFAWAIVVTLPTAVAGIEAQSADELSAERTAYAQWLETGQLSPYAAIYHQRLSDRLVFGPGGDPALLSLPAATLSEGRFRLSLETADGTRTVPRNRDVPLGAWRIRASGSRGRTVVTVFGQPSGAQPPGWYPVQRDDIIDGTLEPPSNRETRRMLGLDGLEVEATLAGVFVSEMNDLRIRLTVYRMPEPGSEEAELMIFFRDETNGNGTYPAGRFLALRPLSDGRYRADFNRARNPFCAYNTIFPCPLPWQGNTLPIALEVGERYESHQPDTNR